MTKFDKEMIDVFDGFVEDNGWIELFEILFPGQTPGEIVLDIFMSGLIPTDAIELILLETGEGDE